jgi:heme exporter protein D
MMEFLAMGGYAAYVWSAYGLTLLVFIGNVAWARRRLHAALRDLRADRRPAEPLRRPVVREIS